MANNNKKLAVYLNLHNYTSKILQRIARDITLYLVRRAIRLFLDTSGVYPISAYHFTVNRRENSSQTYILYNYPLISALYRITTHFIPPARPHARTHIPMAQDSQGFWDIARIPIGQDSQGFWEY